jgi:hypothetical protein
MVSKKWRKEQKEEERGMNVYCKEVQRGRKEEEG